MKIPTLNFCQPLSPTLMTGFALLAFGLTGWQSAFADVTQYTCKIAELKINPETVIDSATLTVKFDCGSSGPLGPNVIGFAPITEKMALEQFKKNQSKIDVTFASKIGGVISELNGRPVSKLNPKSEHDCQLVLVAEAGSTFDQDLGRYLDRQGISFQPRTACNRRRPEEPCRQVQDRILAISLPATIGAKLWSIQVSQSGGSFAYGRWTEGYARVEVAGFSDQPGGNDITLSETDSQLVRDQLNFGQALVFRGHNTSDQSAAVGMTDDGKIIRVRLSGRL
ncbi:MAG: hypothetical protein EOP09_00925 [Proteobacteria bacterium]|nr:MAG: hypothetical protein EOP09_00925 [Pseudomonadota bacterium]